MKLSPFPVHQLGQALSQPITTRTLHISVVTPVAKPRSQAAFTALLKNGLVNTLFALARTFCTEKSPAGMISAKEKAYTSRASPHNV